MIDNKAQAFIDKVAAGDDRGVRSEGLFEAQLHAVLNTLGDPRSTWPARLRVRFDGPDLSQFDKDVMSQLLLHVEDDSSSIVARPTFLQELQKLDSDEAWSSVKRSAAKLMQTAVRMRHDSEVQEVRLVEDMAELSPGVLKVVFGGDLLCAMHGRGTTGSNCRGPRVLARHEVMAVLRHGQKKLVEGGWPYPFYTVGKPLRQLASGDWMIEIFGCGKPEGRGELSLRALLTDEDCE